MRQIRKKEVFKVILQKKRTLVAVAVSVIMAILRTLVVVYNMEKNSYETSTYYLPENIYVKSFDTVTVVFVLLFVMLAISLLFSRRTDVELDNANSTESMILLAFTLFFAAFVCGKNILASEEEIFGIPFVCAVLALATGVAFLILGTRTVKKTPACSTLSLVMILPIAFSGMRLVETFLESNAAPLASSGDYRILGLASVLVYFLYEGKSYVTKNTAVIYYLSGYFSVFFLLVYSLPNLVLHCFGAFAFDSCAAYSVADIGICAYICSRMFRAKLIRKLK
jgi:hypothetical protein